MPATGEKLNAESNIISFVTVTQASPIGQLHAFQLCTPCAAPFIHANLHCCNYSGKRRQVTKPSLGREGYPRVSLLLFFVLFLRFGTPVLATCIFKSAQISFRLCLILQNTAETAERMITKKLQVLKITQKSQDKANFSNRIKIKTRIMISKH